VRIVILDSLRILTLKLVAAQPDVPETNVDMLTLQPLETSTEPWLVPDVSIATWDLQLVLLATAMFIGWLPKKFKRFLTGKLSNSNTSGEMLPEEVNKEHAILKISTQ